MFVRQRLTSLICKQRFTDLECFADLVRAGKVTPSVGASYSLEQVPQAMRELEAGHARAKITIVV